MLLSIDTEDTGLDFCHGTKPFLVTTCNDKGVQQFWRWDVDPLTRDVSPPKEDLQEIINLVFGGIGDDGPELILQNAKFDVRALGTVTGPFTWPWDKTHDTLIAGHLLASNHPHDLTSLAAEYLGRDVQPLEDALEAAVQSARRLCRTKPFAADFGEWRIAGADLPEMPSAKGKKTWKADTWLPYAVVKAGYVGDRTDGWDTVLEDYANADSEVTLLLWLAMKEEVNRRGLWEVYLERRKVVRVAHDMECRGVTLSRPRLESQRAEYREESNRLGAVCVGIAESLGYDLDLPKGANNASLRNFCFGPLGLPPLARSEKTGEPSLDEAVIEEYTTTLPAGSKQLLFVKSLRDKRKRDTAVAYMDGYEKFWLPYGPGKAVGVKSRAVTSWRINSAEEYPYLKAIRALPDDPGPLLVYAEWLLEHGRQDLADAVLRYVRYDHEEYVLHPNLNPTGTDTLRWSSSNPNEMNISKLEGFNLRHSFGPAKGREWWSLDAQNIELRIPTFEAGETELMRVFLSPKEAPYYGSYHLVIFDLLHPKMFALHGKDCKTLFESTWYQWVKNGNFAILYGAQEGTADRTYHVKGAYGKIRNRFPKIAALSDRQLAFAESHGYVETMPDRTVNPHRGYPLLCSRSHYGRVSPTVPLNYHVQGTAMQWTAKAMVRVHEFFCQLNRGDEFAGRAWPGGYFLTLQVHDELVPDMPAGPSPVGEPWAYNLPVIREVKRLMELGGNDIGLPTPVGVEYHGETWAEGVSVSA